MHSRHAKGLCWHRLVGGKRGYVYCGISSAQQIGHSLTAVEVFSAIADLIDGWRVPRRTSASLCGVKALVYGTVSTMHLTRKSKITKKGAHHTTLTRRGQSLSSFSAASAPSSSPIWTNWIPTAFKWCLLPSSLWMASAITIAGSSARGEWWKSFFFWGWS